MPARLALMLLCLCLLACAGSRRQTQLMQQTSIDISADELRARVRVSINPATAAVDRAARQALASAPGPEIRLRIKSWRSETVTVLHTALLYDDPLASLIETMVYLKQQRFHLQEDGPGSGHFGPAQAIILDGVDTMAAQLMQLAAGIEQDPAAIERFDRKLDDWARQHPLRIPWLGRPSVVGDLATLVGSDRLGTMGTISRLSDDIGTISARLAAYNDHLPQRLSWAVDLLIERQLGDGSTREMIAALPAMRDELASIRTLTDERTADADQLIDLAIDLQQRIDGVEARLARYEEHLGTIADNTGPLRESLAPLATYEAALDELGAAGTTLVDLPGDPAPLAPIIP